MCWFTCWRQTRRVTLQVYIVHTLMYAKHAQYCVHGHICGWKLAILPAHTSVCAKHVHQGNLLHKPCYLHKRFTNLCSEVMCSLITTLNVHQTRTLVPSYLSAPVCHQLHCWSYSFVFLFCLMMCFCRLCGSDWPDRDWGWKLAKSYYLTYLHVNDHWYAWSCFKKN